MKVLRVILPLVLAGVIVLLVTSRLTARGEVESFRLQREALRREMIERSVVARGAGGPAGLDEARAVLRWWLDAWAGLRNRFPGPAREGDQRPAGKDAPEDVATWYRYADERLDTLRSGYAPTVSAVDQGLRLDVLAIRPGEHPDTHERGIRIDFAAWGAPRRIERDAGEGARTAPRVTVPLSFRQLGFRFIDAAGKTYGEMIGSGEPYLVLRDPERFTGGLPPGIAFGTWWVEPFPREAARVELSVGMQVQGTGATVLAPSFRWELPVDEAWKLRPGEAFRAETREAPPETPGR